MKKILLLATVLWLGCICLYAENQAVQTYDPATTNDTVNVVYVTFDGNSASAVVCENIKDLVTITIDAAKVSIVQSSGVSASTGEITYELTGSSTNGSFYMEGAYKAGVALRGLTLTNPSGPAIDIQNGKRIEISVKRDTYNVLTDGTSSAADAWKGALQCKGHIEFKGYGTLDVYGNYANAIWAKEYITVKNCTINVLKAVKDGINCNQYFAMESGLINISGIADDGISVGLKNNDTSAENTGNFTMTGGTINIDPTGISGKPVNATGESSVASTATLNTSWTSDLEDVQKQTVSATKLLRDGQVIIIRNGKIYHLDGK